MSTGLLACVALLGALSGLAAPRAARHFTAPPAPRERDPARDHAAGTGTVPGTVPHAEDTPAVARDADKAPAVVRDGEAGPSVVRVVKAAWGASAGALVFAGLAATLGADPALPVLLALAAVGQVLALVDLACLRLPDPLVGTAGLVAAVGLTGVAATSGNPGHLLGAVAGAVLCFACHVLLALLPGSRLGFGDVKLAAVLGLPLGWLGGPTLALGLLLPHLLHGVVVLVLLAAGRVRRDTPLPLGPALLTGAWLAALTA
ncbi:prepilin peptidase [Micromonospora sp. NPDC049048]|uniref:prepilin peptidase n=1 Tax=Micromonospora sp. NPDC049048 TaxID=3364263 RepID=UPI00371041BC